MHEIARSLTATLWDQSERVGIYLLVLGGHWWGGLQDVNGCERIPGHTVDIMMSKAHLKYHWPRIRAR